MPTRAIFDDKGGRLAGRSIELKSPKSDGPRIAHELYQAIRRGRMLASREVEVVIYDDGSGEVIVGGMRRAGRFTLHESEQERNDND